MKKGIVLAQNTRGFCKCGDTLRPNQGQEYRKVNGQVLVLCRKCLELHDTIKG